MKKIVESAWDIFDRDKLTFEDMYRIRIDGLEWYIIHCSTKGLVPVTGYEGYKAE